MPNGRRDRRLRQRLRRVPFAGAQDHVEAPFAVEVLADEHAVAQRAHHRADVAARPAHLVEAAIVRVEAQLGLGHFQALEGLHLRPGHLFLDELLGMRAAASKRRKVGGLELEVDVAAVAEAAEQVALRGERLGVGKADQHFFVDEPAELVDVVRVERAHADAGAERARQHVVVLERGLLLARHVGRQALGERLHELPLDGVDVGARRRLDEAVDGVALYRRQVVERRQQRPR